MAKTDTLEVLSYIDFDRVLRESSSTFPDLIGFYESDAPGTHEAEAINLFLNEYGHRLQNCDLLSSLTDFAGSTEFWCERDRQIADDLQQQGWFHFGKDKESTQRDFSHIRLDRGQADRLKDVCSLVFRGLTYGYMFLSWHNEGLVAYPHKCEGFGLIARDMTAGEKMARRFLKRVESVPGFTVELRK